MAMRETETSTRVSNSAGARKASGSVLVIGIGNEFRSDDAIGPLAVRAMKSEAEQGVRFVEHSGEGAGLMELWRGAERVILLDAVMSGAPPGTIHRRDLSREGFTEDLSFNSSHAFGVAEGVAAARILGLLPPELILMGIEPGSFAPGMSVSPAVRASLSTLVQRVQDEIRPRFARPI